MAYRFTNTEKWQDGWFYNLKPLEKLLFIYLCDNCDIAGFIEYIPEKYSADTGIDKKTIDTIIKGYQKGIVFSKDRSVLFLINFLRHQKNLPLSENVPTHRGIIQKFNKYSNVFEYQNYKEFIERVSKGYQYPLGNGNGNGNGNGEGKKGGVGEKGESGKKQKEFSPPTFEEVKNYFIEKGFSPETAKRAYEGYEVADWHDSNGKKIKNWKQKMIQVWHKPENIMTEAEKNEIEVQKKSDAEKQLRKKYIADTYEMLKSCPHPEGLNVPFSLFWQKYNYGNSDEEISITLGRWIRYTDDIREKAMEERSYTQLTDQEREIKLKRLNEYYVKYIGITEPVDETNG